MRRSVALALLALASSASADEAADPIVLRVGQTVVHASELRARLAKLHDFERKSYGTTDADLKRRYLERKLIAEVLVAEAARVDRIEERPAVRARVNQVLVTALKDSINDQIDKTLTAGEIRKYCEEHPPSGAASGTRGAVQNCARDHLSYRIALRREKVHAEMKELTDRLRKEQVKNVDLAPLSELTTPSAPKESAEKRD